MRILYLLCQCFCIGQVLSYRRYAEPLQVLQPNKDGVYEVDMVVSRKLSMSVHTNNQYQHGTPLDYDPATKKWTRRNPDQTVDCFANFSMNPNTNSGDAQDMEDVLVMDGRHKRIVTINGISPGTTVVVPYGAEVLLKVKNNLLMDAITMHVHGVDKHGLWYMDGVAFVQQCPITSTNYFEYRFIADNVGTHWYHGHMQSDRGDGLLGGFVVVNASDRSVATSAGTRVVPKREYYLMLQDWTTIPSEEAWQNLDDKTMKWMYGFDDFSKCWQPTRTRDGGNVGGAVPISAITVNDKGWYSQEDILNRPNDLPVERFKIRENEDVLLRIVNGGVAQELMMYIEDHKMTVTAGDGDTNKPVQVDRLVIFPGERYDVLIKGLKTPNKKSYLVQFETMEYYKWNWSKMPTTYGAAFLDYEGVTKEVNKKPNYLPTMCTADHKCTVLNCPYEHYAPEYNFTCIAYDKLEHPAPEQIDPEVIQNTPFKTGYEEHFINMHFDSHVDGYKFKHPMGMPYFYEGHMDEVSLPCNETLCPRGASKYDRNCRCFYHKEHKLGNMVQITIFNMGTGGGFGTGYAHPFHIHGHHFHVMKVGWPTYNATGHIHNMNPDIDCAGPDAVCDGAVWRNKTWLNGAIPNMNKRPPLRDTVTLPVGGYITLRFRAVNPGWFYAHCHLVLHHMGGTAYAFRVGTHEQTPPPPRNFPHGCGTFKITSIPQNPTNTNPESTTKYSSRQQLSFLCHIFTILIAAMILY